MHKLDRESIKDKIVFLGTAGARFVVFGFFRHAGGMWMNIDNVNIYVDPGPGAFVYSSKKGLKPPWLDYIVISHRHLDHCADANSMIEAMTVEKKDRYGVLFCPSDAIDNDPVVLEYCRSKLKKTQTVRQNDRFKLSDTVSLSFPVRLRHSVENYGMVFKGSDRSIGYISDTKYFNGLADYFVGLDVLIINTTLLKPKSYIDHLSAVDAEGIIKTAKPKVAILKHFGMTMIKAKPWEVASKIESSTGIKTVAAWDDMILDLKELTTVKQR